MKKTRIAIPACLLVLSMARAEVVVTHQDTYVQYNTPGGNYQGGSTLLLQDHVAGNYRKAYIKFNVSSVPEPSVAGDVTLRLVVDHDNKTSLQPFSSAIIGVYGIHNSPDQDGWAAAALTKINAPENNQDDNGFGENSTWLGDIAIDSENNGGTVLTLSNQALADFVASDSNGYVTIALNFNSISGDHNYAVWLAAIENTTYDAASLTVISEPGRLD